RAAARLRPAGTGGPAACARPLPEAAGGGAALRAGAHRGAAHRRRIAANAVAAARAARATQRLVTSSTSGRLLTVVSAKRPACSSFVVFDGKFTYGSLMS